MSISRSERTAGRQAFTRRTFRESLLLRQDTLDDLRLIIADDNTTDGLTGRLQRLEDTPDDGDIGHGRLREQSGDVALATQGRKDGLTKVLEARHVRHGRSLLEYAAAMGKGNHFTVLGGWLRWKLGVGGLVKQLREPGVNGAPLLFQAATNNAACFDAVKKVILDTLGAGGLAQQVKATDEGGQTLLMYAARYASVAVFQESWELVGEVLTGEDATRIREQRDGEGRSFLHHAAEASSDEKLAKVISGVQELQKVWSQIDRQGRTPAMCLLGREHSHSEEERKDDNSDASLETNMKALLRVEPKLTGLLDPWNQLTTAPGDNNDSIDPGSDNLSGMMHAARGGRETFDAAFKLITTSDCTSGKPRVAVVLGLDLESPAVGERRERLLAQLLGQAALGGDVSVLEEISTVYCEAQDNTDDRRHERCARLATKTDYTLTASELLQAACRGRRHVSESGGYMAGELEAMGTGDGGGNFTTSLFALTVLSGNKEAVQWAKSFVLEFTDKDKTAAWSIFCGKGCCVSPLTYAALTSSTSDIFEAVYTALKEAAEGSPHAVETGMNKVRAHLLSGDTWKFTPLAGAMFCGTPELVKTVISAYGKGLTQRKMMDQIQGVLIRKDLGSSSYDDIPSEVRLLLRGYGYVILESILNAAIKELNDLKACSTGTTADAINNEEEPFYKAVVDAELENSIAEAKRASERGAFDGLRVLIEKGWDCRDYLPSIISRIGDQEAGVIDTVLCAIESARTTSFGAVSNPFVVSAIASSEMGTARSKRPGDCHSLDKLQREIDNFTTQLLGKLPATVRGVGLELIGSFDLLTLDGKRGEDGFPGVRGSRQDAANLVGYIAVRWMLEPSLHAELEDRNSFRGNKSDPLQQALDRGLEAHAFTSAPLILDYMQLKWSCTVPNWSRRYPFDSNVNESFCIHDATPVDTPQRNSCINGVLRILQGWDIQTPFLRDEDPGSFSFPHSTVLPGLQFSMAGIIGKPEEFFLVPSVRFFYETFSYLSMLGWYISCVSITNSEDIPPNEIIFYIFALTRLEQLTPLDQGLLWREVLEFEDAMELPPVVADPEPDINAQPKDQTKAIDIKRGDKGAVSTAQHHFANGVQRYFTQDNWNILDTASIACMLVAFFFRLTALVLVAEESTLVVPDNFPSLVSNLSEEEFKFSDQAFYTARFFLAVIAPLLFARVLSLAQVDKYLGPLTQIIWTMLFHLVRFSLFMLVVMLSFALAFYALFNTCGEDSEILSIYGTFGSSLLAMFEAMLGAPNFDVFDKDDFPCQGPTWQYDAGVALLVLYMVNMAILMLNLLIAVLSTVHDTVHERAELEFNLARNQFIQRGAGVVARGHLPPPLNLLMVVVSAAIDVVLFAPAAVVKAPGTCMKILRACMKGVCTCLKRMHSCFKSSFKPETKDSAAPRPLPANASGGGETPVHGGGGGTSSCATVPADQLAKEVIRRLLFALTMGLLALGATALLWIVSLPSVTIGVVRWFILLVNKATSGCLARLRAGKWSCVMVAIYPVASIFAFFVAIGVCALCIFGSVVLWLKGLCGVFGCGWKPAQAEGSVMPGAWGVDGAVWKVAKDIVEASNVSRKKGKLAGEVDSNQHFDVELFLRMTTGWDLCHLSSLVRRQKEEELKKEDALLREIDDKRSEVRYLPLRSRAGS